MLAESRESICPALRALLSLKKGVDDAAEVSMRGLTFELSGRQRQDARARAEKMYTVPQAGPWWPAEALRLSEGLGIRTEDDYEPNHRYDHHDDQDREEIGRAHV